MCGGLCCTYESKLKGKKEKKKKHLFCFKRFFVPCVFFNMYVLIVVGGLCVLSDCGCLE